MTSCRERITDEQTPGRAVQTSTTGDAVALKVTSLAQSVALEVQWNGESVQQASQRR